MPKYGRIKDGRLELSSKKLEGYKSVTYEKLPESFDQTTQYAEQRSPTDHDDHIFVGIEIKDLELDDGYGEDELF